MVVERDGIRDAFCKKARKLLCSVCPVPCGEGSGEGEEKDGEEREADAGSDVDRGVSEVVVVACGGASGEASGVVEVGKAGGKSGGPAKRPFGCVAVLPVLWEDRGKPLGRNCVTGAGVGEVGA